MVQLWFSYALPWFNGCLKLKRVEILGLIVWGAKAWALDMGSLGSWFRAFGFRVAGASGC